MATVGVKGLSDVNNTWQESNVTVKMKNWIFYFLFGLRSLCAAPAHGAGITFSICPCVNDTLDPVWSDCNTDFEVELSVLSNKNEVKISISITCQINSKVPMTMAKAI